VAAYLQAAVLFAIILAGNYPPIRSEWFAKSMAFVFLMHILIQVVFAALALGSAVVDIRMPTRMFYGFVATATIGEGYAAFRIIDGFRPD